MMTLPQSISELCINNLHNIAQEKVINWSGAVNLLIIHNEIVFIKRSELVPSHKGQIAFMGGHKLVGESPLDCAMREFSEESSISVDILSPQGLLPPVQTSMGSVIVPVLSNVQIPKEDFFLQANSNGEWEEIFTVPIHYFLNQKWIYGNLKNQLVSDSKILFCPLSKNDLTSKNELTSSDYLLWGATAKMVWDYLMLRHKC